MTLWRQVTSLEGLVVANEMSAGFGCLIFARTNVLCVGVLLKINLIVRGPRRNKLYLSVPNEKEKILFFENIHAFITLEMACTLQFLIRRFIPFFS